MLANVPSLTCGHFYHCLQRHSKIEEGLKAFNIAKYVPSSHESNQDVEAETVTTPISESDSEQEGEEEEERGIALYT